MGAPPPSLSPWETCVFSLPCAMPRAAARKTQGGMSHKLRPTFALLSPYFRLRLGLGYAHNFMDWISIIPLIGTLGAAVACTVMAASHARLTASKQQRRQEEYERAIESHLNRVTEDWEQRFGSLRLETSTAIEAAEASWDKAKRADQAARMRSTRAAAAGIPGGDTPVTQGEDWLERGRAGLLNSVGNG